MTTTGRESMAENTPPAVPVSVLLVDDRQENLLALEAILEPLSHRLIRASSGEEALRALLANDVAVILLDVQMPGMSGFETARIIKSRERTRHIPLIFLTAISKEEEYVFEGYSVGAIDYLFKPFHPEILRSKVAALVDMYVKEQRFAAQEQKLREAVKQDLELRHMRELLQSEARYRDIVRSAMDAILTFDDGGRILQMNVAAERMFGWRAADAIGESVERLFPPPKSGGHSLDRLRELAEAARSSRRERGGGGSSTGTQPVPLRACRRDATDFPVEVSASFLESPDGDTYTLIIRDVSDRVRHEEALRQQAISLARSTEELRQLNEELNHRQADLERAMTARNRFYASMSHELRTPINAVLGYSTLLLERIYGPLNDKQAEGILRTQKAARHLLELVNDVLDLSKIEAGKIELRPQPVSIPELIEDLFVTVRPLADQHQSTLSMTTEGDPKPIVSDPRRVRQILMNLLSNAIKFGSGRPIEVVCRMRDNGGVAVEVIDHGEGIPGEDQERIFHEFVQLGKTQLQDGTGLGLPISRRLAELLTGTLTVKSTPGNGSTFCLALPREVESRQRVVDQERRSMPVDERPGKSRPAAAESKPRRTKKAEGQSEPPAEGAVVHPEPSSS